LSKLHITRIANKLNLLFGNLIPKEGESSRFLSQALASFYLKHSCGISSRDAVEALTDGFHDCGIDAIYIDHVGQTLVLVQSKFSQKGTGSVGKDCVLKFLEGFSFLIDGEFDKFNEKVQSKKEELSKVLFDDPYKIELVLVHTGIGNLSKECTESFESIKKNFNDTDETLTYLIRNQHDLYSLVMSNVDGDPVNFENLTIYDWGCHNEPHLAFYGEVEASVIGEWWKSCGMRLLIKNIRQYKQDSVINKHIISTLITKPDDFWYFNNGLILICKKVKKTLAHGTRRDKGIFNLYGAQIVNGAQTYGCIGNASLRFSDKVADARVFVKIIEVKDLDSPYYKEITRYTNTQNNIADKDFAALDPEQERLRMELKLDGVEYIYKYGEQPVDESKGFDLEEATVALACAQADINYAVMAKGKIKKFWEDIDRSPYNVIFNKSVSGLFLWRLVQVVRMIDKRINDHKQKDYNSKELSRSRNLLTYGNRIIAHKVLNYLPVSILSSDLNLTELKNKVDVLTLEVTRHLASAHHEFFSDDSIQAVFQNRSKNQRLSDKIDHFMGYKEMLFTNEE